MNAHKRLLQLATVTREWDHCERCPLGCLAFKHVLYEIPDSNPMIDVLFVGEAPGRSEDAIGRPFIGRSGKFLRKVIGETNHYNLTVGFSNLLACRPTDSAGKDRRPEPSEVAACSPRLNTIIQTLEPWAIVGLGKVPEELLPPIMDESGWNGIRAWFRHPAYLLRTGGEQSPEYPVYVSRFQEIFETVNNYKHKPVLRK